MAMINHRQIAITLILDLDKAEALRSLVKQQVDMNELILEDNKDPEWDPTSLQDEFEVGKAFMHVLDVAIGHATI